jgi:hypothetical protein
MDQMAKTSIWVVGMALLFSLDGCQTPPDEPAANDTAKRAATSCGNLCDDVCLGSTSCNTECNILQQQDEDRVCQPATCGSASTPCNIDGESPGRPGDQPPGPAAVAPCLDTGPNCHPVGDRVLVGRAFRKVLEGQKPQTPRLVTRLFDILVQKVECSAGNLCTPVRGRCDIIFAGRNNSSAGAFGYQGGSCVQLAP